MKVKAVKDLFANYL